MARRSINSFASAGGSPAALSGGGSPEKSVTPVLCAQIRRYREEKGLEQKAFAALLGVTANAVSTWERGRARPDVALLPEICRVLGITLYELYGRQPPGDLLSSRERALVDGYRALSSGGRYVLDRTLEALRFSQKAESGPELRELLYFSRPLAAGTADPTEFEQDAELFYLYASPEVDRSDYVFKTSGDSMEPDYHSGDLVLVEKLTGGAALHYGEIGAFIVGNETYIKRYEKDGLHSLNRKYGVLRFDEEQSVFLIGRVVGIVSQKDIPSRADVEAYLELRSFARV